MGRVARLLAIPLLIFLATAINQLYAQKEYDVWHFGANYGLDFRGALPAAIIPQIWTLEGSASICDRRTGAPLFYTDGITVWNRNNVVMANGTGLLGHYSSAQSALIVPIPCDTNRYYIFTSDHQGYYDPPRGIHYSVVDMRLNGGLGAVTVKNVPLQASASERLVAVAHGNGRDYWVVTHSLAGRTFYAWRITGVGVAASPVVSVAGFDQGPPNSNGPWTYGYLKASPNGRKLAATSLYWNTAELFDFDAATGRVTNPIMVYQGPVLFTPGSGPYYCYGITFSPDNSRLYHGVNATLLQYDVTLPTAAAIVASRTTIASSPGMAGGVTGALQIGPDGAIYTMNNATFNTWVGRIANPNVLGQGCNYTASWRQFTWNALESIGLPNNIDAKATTVTSDSSFIGITPRGPVVICRGDRATLTADAGFVSYRWNTGATTQSITADTAGTYSVTAFDTLGCSATAAVEVRVIPLPRPVITGPKEFCDGDSITLVVVPDTSIRRVLWSTGETTRSITVRRGGTYTVSAWNYNDCKGDTSYTVTMNPNPTPTITGEIEFCSYESTTLDAGAGYKSYLWSNGATARTIIVRTAGTYHVTVTNQFDCLGRDTVTTVVHTPPDPTITADRTTFCDGDSAVLRSVPGAKFYRWSTGESTQNIVVRKAGRYTLIATSDFGCSDTAAIDITVNPNPIPVVRAIPDTKLCDGDSVVLDAGVGYTEYLWSTGETSRQIVVRKAGSYTVRVVDGNGCAGLSDPVDIIVNPLPDAKIAGARGTCPDVSISYSVAPTSGALYVWTVSGGTLASGQGTPLITVNWKSPGRGSVAVRVTNSSTGCSAGDSINVTINSELIPTITPSRPPKLCEGDSVMLDAGTGYKNYRWSTGETTRTIMVRQPGNYTVSVIDSNGCTGASDPLNVVVNPNPFPRITISPKADFCEGDSVLLDAGPGFADYLWSNGATTRTITLRTSGTFAVTVTDANGCIGSSPLVSVRANPIPEPEVEGPRLVCRYSVMEYTVKNNPGSSYQWRVTGGTILGGQGTADLFVKWGAGPNGTIEVVETTPAGCSGSTGAITVIVGDVLKPEIAIIGSARICEGDSVVLDAGVGFDRYQWSTGETTRFIVVRQAGSYTVRVEDNAGCSGNSGSIDVTINPHPVPSIAGRKVGLCDGESTTLDAPDGYVSWVWSTGETTRFITVNRPGIYTVRVTDTNGCSALSAGDTVVIYSAPAKPTISAIGDILTSTPAIAYQWHYGGVDIPSGTSRSYRKLYPGVYTVTITDINGCQAISDPYIVASGHIAWLDTVHAHVGERVFLTMRISPPLTIDESIAGYTVRLKLAPKALYPYGVTSPDEAVTGETATMKRERDGWLLLERPNTGATLVGDELFKLNLEGLSTGHPDNIVGIESVILRQREFDRRPAVQMFYDSVIIAGDGLVILTGCDITHGFAFGKRGVLRSVTPNPAQREMVVTYMVPMGALPRLILVDMAGHELRRIDLPSGTGAEQSITVEVLDTPSGLYMIELRDGAERSVVPLIIAR